MKIFRMISLAVVMILTHFLLHAQSAPPDSIVQWVAEAQGLSRVPADGIPDWGGTWYTIIAGSATAFPYPVLPPGNNLPIYALNPTMGIYLVDGTAGDTGASADLIAAQSNAVINLIALVQNSTPSTPTGTVYGSLDGSPVAHDGFGGGARPNDSGFNPDPNSLWLQMTNVANGLAYLNLNEATDYVYEIWSTTNLTSPWNIETEVFPTNPVVNPFVVQEQGQPNLFIWARDWTGISENGNTTPDWWLWQYFGTLDLFDTNLDSQGNSLLVDYESGFDPNIIYFSLSTTNMYQSNDVAELEINVNSGSPAYVAVLIDSTNFQQAAWSTYLSSNINVALGDNYGAVDVHVGLKGSSVNATPTWENKHLARIGSPLLTITNPAANIIGQPIIQLMGYCQFPLATISYDISNSSGIYLNQPAEVTEQFYDTNICAFTTNYFSCPDVPLSSGPNIITIHAIDLAGESADTNINFTLDLSSMTSAPILQISWPQNLSQLGGSFFTCVGTVNDISATVETRIIFSNGDPDVVPGGIYTNVYVATVERNGTFWLENLPLNQGTNRFQIEAVDAAGYISTTNLIVIHSQLQLAINPVVPDSQLWQSTVNLTGTISDPTYAVWVNGVKGYNNGDGTWSAENVPVNNGGTASFNAAAYASDEQQPDGSYGN